MSLHASFGWAFLCVLGSVGCGEATGSAHHGSGGLGGEPLAYARSGSRLWALGYASNEARIFDTFHDEALGFDCSFAPAANGVDQRCVPKTTFAIVYTNAACTEPATWFHTYQRDAPRRGDAVSSATPITPSCPGDEPPHRDTYRVAEQLTEEVIGDGETSVFALRDGRCEPTSFQGKATPPLHRLVAVPETELVRGERVSHDLGGGLRATRVIADDGAELTLGVTGADGTPCEFQRDGECVPEPIARPALAEGDRFSLALSDDCASPAFSVPYSPSCGAAKFGVEDDHEGLLRVRTLKKATTLFQWERIQPFTMPYGYLCSGLSLPDYASVVAPDRDVTGTLPIADKLRRGSGPLHVDWFAIGDRELLPAVADWRRASPGVVPQGEFVNAEGQVCEVTLANDGSLRCAVLDQLGLPRAELTTFPEVVRTKF